MKKRLWLPLLCLTLTAFAAAAPSRRAAKAQKPVEPPAPWAVPADSIPVATPAMERFEVDGLAVRARTESGLPRFEATLAARAVADTPNQTAYSLLSTALLRSGGVEGLEGPAFARHLARTGLSLDVIADPDFTRFTVRGAKEQIPAALKLIADLARTPAYPEDEVARALNALRGLTRLRARNPLTAAVDRLNVELFGDHIYAARFDDGALDAMTRETLLQAHARQFIPNQAMLAIASPLEPSALQAAVSEAFKGWQSGTAAVRPERPPATSAGRAVDAPVPGAGLAVTAGRVVAPTNDIDRVATRVLAQVIDGSIRARVAGREGYGRAGARLTRHADAAVLWDWAEGSDLAGLKRVVQGELARAGRGELTDAEIARARVAVLSEVLQGLDGMAALVRAAALEELQGGDPAWPPRQVAMLRTLEPAEVRRVARTLLGGNAVVVVSCGPEAALAQTATAPAHETGASGAATSASHDPGTGAPAAVPHQPAHLAGDAQAGAKKAAAKKGAAKKGAAKKAAGKKAVGKKHKKTGRKATVRTSGRSRAQPRRLPRKAHPSYTPKKLTPVDDHKRTAPAGYGH